MRQQIFISMYIYKESIHIFTAIAKNLHPQRATLHLFLGEFSYADFLLQTHGIKRLFRATQTSKAHILLTIHITEASLCKSTSKRAVYHREDSIHHRISLLDMGTECLLRHCRAIGKCRHVAIDKQHAAIQSQFLVSIKGSADSCLLGSILALVLAGNIGIIHHRLAQLPATLQTQALLKILRSELTELILIFRLKLIDMIAFGLILASCKCT